MAAHFYIALIWQTLCAKWLTCFPYTVVNSFIEKGKLIPCALFSSSAGAFDSIISKATSQYLTVLKLFLLNDTVPWDTDKASLPQSFQWQTQSMAAWWSLPHQTVQPFSRFHQIVYLPIISQNKCQKPIHRMAQKKQDMSHSGDWLHVFLWGRLDNQDQLREGW